MSFYTSIEWTNASWNPVTGCRKISPGCDHCYAEAITHRFPSRFPNGFDFFAGWIVGTLFIFILVAVELEG